MHSISFFSKKWQQTAAFLVTLALVFTASFSYFPRVTERANAATATVENLLSSGATLDGFADRIPVFKISVSGTSENLTGFKVRLVGSGGANFSEGAVNSSILANLDNNSDVSGIGVYVDSSTVGTPGSLDWEDTPVNMNNPTYSSNTVTLSLGNRPLQAGVATYFITVKPKDNGLTNGESFTIGMNNGDIFTSVTPPTFSNVTTGALTVSAAPKITKIMAFENDGTTPVTNG
ncbi:hypothetical protein HZA41_03355, partial [Candidatus Peregrinibacteria bacterium]|nr:hypothetical protein [Candidatus Peregrinibacteria bacterium]